MPPSTFFLTLFIHSTLFLPKTQVNARIRIQHFAVFINCLFLSTVISATTFCCVLVCMTTKLPIIAGWQAIGKRTPRALAERSLNKKMKELRTIIKDLREDKDIKQKTIAEYLGVSQQSYSNYENGHREIPIWAVTKLASFYQVSIDYLLGSEEGYAGNTNLSDKYLGDITMHDVVYDIQKLSPQNRRDLLKYIKFLKQSDPEI